MKRDLDLIRKLLLKLEETELIEFSENIEVDGYSQEEVTYHAYLLWNAGFVEAQDCCHQDGDNYLIQRITFSGHDYIDAVRDEGIWNRIKVKLGAVGGTATIDVVKQLAVSAILKAIE